jgi:hypothetical protein
MLRTVWFLVLAPALLGGCDNRTQDARRSDEIAQKLDNGSHVQPWKDAKSPWSSVLRKVADEMNFDVSKLNRFAIEDWLNAHSHLFSDSLRRELDDLRKQRRRGPKE